MTDGLKVCGSHLRRLTAAAAQTGGAMWPSVVDVRTGRMPGGAPVPRRVYRLIGAPRGSTLYWDQPLLVAAFGLSRASGDPAYAQAADRYVAAFLEHCVAANGMFRWGNHQYYDVLERKVVEFHEGYHELRPITPAWEVFWRLDPQRTDAYIRRMAARHLYDPARGGFNRHDDGRKGHAFIEAGGILCESLAWLAAKAGDKSLSETALRIARYSFDARNRDTGLVPNEPDTGRWDAKVCTSEIGLWANCLLRAAAFADTGALVEMARDAVRAYLSHACDQETNGYFGQVGVRDGKPVVAAAPGYWPRQYADAWTTDQWPTHDYPTELAEACLSLHGLTGEELFREHALRLGRVFTATRPARSGRWAYAESYGRCIHFLARAGRDLGEEGFSSDARALASEAVAALSLNGMFQGYPGGGLYESVDGIGYLMLALLTRAAPATRNSHHEVTKDTKKERVIKKLRALRAFVVQELVLYCCCWFVRH